MKNNTNREKKSKIIAELVEKTNQAQAIIFTNYEGLTHKQLEGMKKSLRSLDAEFFVAKNTLLKRALKDIDLQAYDQQFARPTGTLFVYKDLILPLKTLLKLAKETTLPSIKFGIVEGKTVSPQDVIRIASLPSKQILLSQLAGQLKSPLARLHHALQWNITKLVVSLKAVETVKSKNSL